ncbi:MAG: esterase family protein [Ignavibacteriaceae bacterium]|nr:esterase family protein [Ignavibacteriaceae bacterium]
MKLLLFISLLICNAFSIQQTIIMESGRIPYADTILVTMPDKEIGNEKLPAVFLLHGWSGDFRQWDKITDLQQLADQYLCYIISPSGFYDSWYINSPVREDIQYQSYFINELLPLIINTFNIDSKNVFVSGLSMGGFGALSLLLHYPDKIKAAGSTSGVLDLTPFPNRWGLEKVLGQYKDYGERYYVYSPMGKLVVSSAFINKIIIDCGTEDFAYEVNREFYNLAKQKKLDIQFISRPGGHTWQYWKESIPYHFLFFSRQFTSSDNKEK